MKIFLTLNIVFLFVTIHLFGQSDSTRTIKGIVYSDYDKIDTNSI